MTCPSCFAGSAEFYIQPTDFDVGFATFKEEESKTATCFRTISPPFGGFIWLAEVWFPTHTSPERELYTLETSDWLTKDSEHWQLTLVLYNPNYDILTICGIHFLQSHSGRIWKQITFMCRSTSKSFIIIIRVHIEGRRTQAHSLNGLLL